MREAMKLAGLASTTQDTYIDDVRPSPAVVEADARCGLSERRIARHRPQPSTIGDSLKRAENGGIAWPEAAENRQGGAGAAAVSVDRFGGRSCATPLILELRAQRVEAPRRTAVPRSGSCRFTDGILACQDIRRFR
jgi:hypothetical protein